MTDDDDTTPPLGPSVVRLFGTVFSTASAKAFQPRASASAKANMLAPGDTTQMLARIYGFSHEGRFIPLQPPALFLVHGDGVEATEVSAQGAIGLLGFAQRTDEFVEGLRVWAYDLNDVTSRLDHTSGTLQDLLGGPPAGVPGATFRRTDILSGQEGNIFGRAGRLVGQG